MLGTFFNGEWVGVAGIGVAESMGNACVFSFIFLTAVAVGE